MKTVAADEIIIHEGQTNEILYKVLQGSFAIYFNYGQKDEFLIGVIAKGKCIGNVSYLIGGPSPYTVVANEESLVLEVTKDNFQDFIINNPRNAIDIMVDMGKIINMYNKHIEDLLSELDENAKVSKDRSETIHRLSSKIINSIYT